MDPQDISELVASLQGKSDHDLLIALSIQMKQVLDRLEKGDDCMDKLDKRVGALERFQSTLLGIAAAISFAVTIIGGKIWNALTGGP